MERLEKIFIVLFVFSIIIRVIFIASDASIWWDEAVYARLGKGIASGYYSLDPNYQIESFRPPMMPFLMFLTGGSIFIGRLLSLVFSVSAVLTIWLLGREVFDRRTAIWASLILLSVQEFLLLSTKALTEPVFITFTALFIIFLFFWEKTKKHQHILLSGIFLGLCLITRYFALVYVIAILGYVFFGLVKKRMHLKDVGALLLGVVVPLIPMAIVNTAYYGNPIGSILHNFAVYAYSPPAAVPIIDLLILWGLPILFALAGFFYLLKKRNSMGLFMAVILLVVFMFLAFSSHVESRYLLSFSPVICIPGGYFIALLAEKRKGVASLLLVLFAAILIANLYLIFTGIPHASALVRGCVELENLSGPDDIIFSPSYPLTYHMADRRTVDMCGIPFNENYFECNQQMLKKGVTKQDIIRVLEENTADYILVYRTNSELPGIQDNQIQEIVESLPNAIQLFNEPDYNGEVFIYSYKTG